MEPKRHIKQYFCQEISQEGSNIGKNVKSIYLSVIMPSYNEKNTLVEILNRVKSVPVKKEIIIVDDGSTAGILLKEGLYRMG